MQTYQGWSVDPVSGADVKELPELHPFTFSKKKMEKRRRKEMHMHIRRPGTWFRAGTRRHAVHTLLVLAWYTQDPRLYLFLFFSTVLIPPRYE
jgi:hypothetical protein